MNRLSLILISILLWTGCQKSSRLSSDERVIPVQIVKIKKAKMAKPIHTGGRLSSSAEMKLSFKIGGIIDQLKVQEGDRVHKGDVLAALKLNEIEAQVNQARSGYEKAGRDFNRAQNLYGDSVATLEQMQDAETGLVVARSNLEIAEFNLNHARITAPTRGRVLKSLAEENELIGPGHPVFFFGAEDQTWIVKLGVTDRDVIRLALKDSASVVFDAYPDVPFSGHINQIAGAPDPMSSTFEIEVSIHERGVPLFNGFIATADIFPSGKSWYTLVPFEAIVDVTGLQGSVFTISSDSLARKIPVTIGYLSDHHAAIKTGLESVTRVITEGSAYLTDGNRVRIIHE